jgi:hypothetical protein
MVSLDASTDHDVNCDTSSILPKSCSLRGFFGAGKVICREPISVSHNHIEEKSKLNGINDSYPGISDDACVTYPSCDADLLGGLTNVPETTVDKGLTIF